jgi:hypothetical protein
MNLGGNRECNDVSSGMDEPINLSFNDPRRWMVSKDDDDDDDDVLLLLPFPNGTYSNSICGARRTIRKHSVQMGWDGSILPPLHLDVDDDDNDDEEYPDDDDIDCCQCQKCCIHGDV